MFVIEFDNCEDWGDGATGYHVSLGEVELNSPRLPEACDSCGLSMDLQNELSEPLTDWTKAECLARYGAAAPLFGLAGTNAHHILRTAKREALHLLTDDEAYAERMAAPVNKIGSTAREYRDGDIQSGVLRGVAAGDREAELMLKLGVK